MIRFFVKLWQCFFMWKVPSHQRQLLSTADVIIGQAFGMRHDSPGISNQALGEQADTVQKETGKPLILQGEIADCLPDRGQGIVIRKHSLPGKYLDTYEFLWQAHLFCQLQRQNQVILIAHQDHRWRVMMVAKKLGFTIIIPDSPPIPYDHQSTQWWTRRRSLFLIREIPARILYVLTGKI
jgi:hypothetical protein